MVDEMDGETNFTEEESGVELIIIDDDEDLDEAEEIPSGEAMGPYTNARVSSLRIRMRVP